MPEHVRTEYAIRRDHDVVLCPDRGTAERIAQWPAFIVRRTVTVTDWATVPSNNDVVDAEVYPEWEYGDHVRRAGNPWWARDWIVVGVNAYTTALVRDDIFRWEFNDALELVPKLEYSDPVGRELAVLR